MIDVLAYYLLKEDKHAKFLPSFVKNKSRLMAMAALPKRSTNEDDDYYWRIIDLICLFHKTYNRLPTVKGLIEYARANSAELKINEAWNVGLKSALEALHEIDPVRLKFASDPDVMIDAVVKDARADWIEAICVNAVGIARSEADMGGEKVPHGATDAKAYLYRALSNDVQTEDAISGSLRQNSQAVWEHLRALYNANNQDRTELGFTELDANFLVGKRFNKLIHILGFSNEGKSVLTRTLAFNAALQGCKTLYVTLEGEDALDCLTKFAFLYGSVQHGRPCPISKKSAHEQCTFTMPSYEDWKMQRCTQEDIDHVMWALYMLRDQHDLPLYVHDRKTMNTWEQIEAAVESENYDCVAVDYLTILDMPDVKAKDRDFALNGIFDKASSLCGRKGTIVISPLQVNREGKKQADAKDPHEEKIYSMVHVSKFSRAYENCDILLAVCSTPEMKQIGEIKIEVLKVREGNYPDVGKSGGFFADVNRGTKHVTELHGQAKVEGKEFAKHVEDAMEAARQMHGEDDVIDHGLLMPDEKWQPEWKR